VYCVWSKRDPEDVRMVVADNRGDVSRHLVACCKRIVLIAVIKRLPTTAIGTASGASGMLQSPATNVVGSVLPLRRRRIQKQSTWSPAPHRVRLREIRGPPARHSLASVTLAFREITWFGVPFRDQHADCQTTSRGPSSAPQDE